MNDDVTVISTVVVLFPENVTISIIALNTVHYPRKISKSTRNPWNEIITYLFRSQSTDQRKKTKVI